MLADLSTKLNYCDLVYLILTSMLYTFSIYPIYRLRIFHCIHYTYSDMIVQEYNYIIGFQTMLTDSIRQSTPFKVIIRDCFLLHLYFTDYI